MNFTYVRQLKRASAVLLFALALTVAGCSGDSECDSCNNNSDCDSGQTCTTTNLGDRCIKAGDNSCNVDITQL
jgi:hypothetical protein